MKLDKRMSAILSEIPECKNLADIGADHGYISISYALNNPKNTIIASDISSKSIQKAKMLAEEYNLTNYFTNVGDGLQGIEEDIDVVLISGMGGEEIVSILKNAKKYSMYILSPQKNVDIVREYLAKNNLSATKDYKVLSNDKFYDILVCAAGKYNPTEKELLYGSGEGEDYTSFVQKEKQRLEQLLKVVNDTDRNEIERKLHLLIN